MPQRKAKFTVVDFAGGVNTDASPISYPLQSARKMENFVLGADGSMQRRLGLHSKASFELPPITSTTNKSYVYGLRGAYTRSTLWLSPSSAIKDIVAINMGGGVTAFYEADVLGSFVEKQLTQIEEAEVMPVPVLVTVKSRIVSSASSSYAEFGDVITAILTSDTLDVNMATIYEDQTGQEPTSQSQMLLSVEVPNWVSSSDVSIPAIDTGTWPEGSLLRINNSAAIRGRGGKGGDAYATTNEATAEAGEDGGGAIKVQHPTIIDNNGIIAGGGGGGGGASKYTDFGGGTTVASAVGGGGGAGPFSEEGIGSAVGSSNPYSDNGEAGTLTTGGAGGEGNETNPDFLNTGGDGGDMGQAGGAGDPNQQATSYYAGGAGGAAGFAIDGENFVTFLNENASSIYGPRNP